MCGGRKRPVWGWIARGGRAGQPRPRAVWPGRAGDQRLRGTGRGVLPAAGPRRRKQMQGAKRHFLSIQHPDAGSLANTPFAALAATPLGTCSTCFRVRSGTVLPGSPETEPGRAPPGPRGRWGGWEGNRGARPQIQSPPLACWAGGRAPVAPGARGQNMPSQKPGRGWRGQRRPL